MRAFLFTFIIFVLGCNDLSKSANNKLNSNFEFDLIDSLGKISISFPNRMDTFFNWIQQSDCGRPCEHGDYRFQSTKNRIFKESGFYWKNEPEDSVNQLTIYHQRPYALNPQNDSLVFKLKEQLYLNVLSRYQGANIIKDTLLKIGDRSFIAFYTADMNYKNKVFDRRLIAFATTKGTVIEFQYKLLTKTYDSTLLNFYNSSLSNLQTVRFKNGG